MAEYQVERKITTKIQETSEKMRKDARNTTIETKINSTKINWIQNLPQANLFAKLQT